MTYTPVISATAMTSSSMYQMFKNCKSIQRADVTLNVPTLTGFNEAFDGCNALISGVSVTAAALGGSAAQYSFRNCHNLKNITFNIDGITEIPSNCFYGAFTNCYSLSAVPMSFADTTTIAANGFREMFSGCSGLTSAPTILPATSFTGTYVYQAMFSGCKSLTTAPELPAETLSANCYQQMFYSCPALRYIKCLATDISASNCLLNWVYGNTNTSDFTFVKKAGVTYPTGNNGVLSNWTIQEV